MIYTIPTKRGLGVELWGTYDDLKTLYAVIGRFWNQEEFLNNTGFDNRDKLISGFSYEIRKAYDGDRLKQHYSRFSLEQIPHFGVKLSWVHVLFSISALRYNMKYYQTDKLDVSVFLQLEYWIEKSMGDFDTEVAKKLMPFLNGGLYSGNPALYQYMRRINLEYAMLGGGKKAFKQLPALMMRGVLNTPEYTEYMNDLEADAKRLGGKVSDLEIIDDDFDYNGLKW